MRAPLLEYSLGLRHGRDETCLGKPRAWPSIEFSCRTGFWGITKRSCRLCLPSGPQHNHNSFDAKTTGTGAADEARPLSGTLDRTSTFSERPSRMETRGYWRRGLRWMVSHDRAPARSVGNGYPAASSAWPPRPPPPLLNIGGSTAKGMSGDGHPQCMPSRKPFEFCNICNRGSQRCPRQRQPLKRGSFERPKCRKSKSNPQREGILQT